MSVDSTTRVGERYIIISVVGRGGMADVYRARDSVLDRDVALKVLRADSTSEPDRDRFVAEGRILAQLSHPNLVTLLDVGVADEPFLVMEFVDGPTLAEHDGRIDLDTVASVGRQLAAALGCAHAAGVVHRDVKPANVLLGPDGRARLTDFGIAWLLADAPRHTAEGLMVGTAAYLAPEQVRQDDVGPRADIYALGLVLLEAITGERAYPGPPVEAALARLTTPPPIPDDLPPDWQRLLRRMTATNPADRPDAAAVNVALRDLGTTTPNTPSVALLPAPPIEIPSGLVGARLLRLGALAAVLLMVTAGVLLSRAGQGVRPVDSDMPDVAASLRLSLEDLHAAVAEVGPVPGLVERLEGVDAALVARRYEVAASRLSRMITWLLSPARGEELNATELDSVLDPLRALLSVLPLPPAPTPEATQPADGGDRAGSVDLAPNRQEDKADTAHNGKSKGKSKGNGKGNGKGKR